MPRTGFSGSLSTPKVDVIVDMGDPFLNLTVDGFLKIRSVAATRAAAEDAYHVDKKGKISNFEDTLRKMCKEGAYWGTVAGVYVGMEYGVERIRGTRDWKNAMIGGALTGFWYLQQATTTETKLFSMQLQAEPLLLLQSSSTILPEPK